MVSLMIPSFEGNRRFPSNPSLIIPSFNIIISSFERGTFEPCLGLVWVLFWPLFGSHLTPLLGLLLASLLPKNLGFSYVKIFEKKRKLHLR